MQSVTIARPPRARSSPATVGAAILAVLTAAVAVWLLVAALQGPAFVEKVVVVNPHGFDVNVHVAGGQGEGQLGLGPVEAESTRTIRSVVDQGDVWVFTFDRAGRPVGEIEVPRSTLEADDWRVEVPSDAPGGS